MTTWIEAKTARTLPATRSAILSALTLAPVSGWSNSAPQRKLVDDFAARLVEESEIRAALAALVDVNELASADDSWADAFATIFGETRIAALPAIWDLSLTTSTPPQSVGPATQMQVQTTSGIIFVMAQAATISLPSSARFTARLPGTGGNVSSSTFGGGKILTGPSGIDVVSAALFTAGRAAETNLELVRRCLAKWPRLGAGWTADAFDYFIPTAAPTVTRWRTRDDNPYGPGTTGVVVANASGPATTPERDAVDAYLNARARRSNGSGPATVTKAVADALSITITIEGDGSNASLDANATAAVQALCDAMPTGVATLDDGLVRAVALGGAFLSISVDIDGSTKTIAPDLPGFTNAKSIVSCSLSGPHTIPLDGVLVASIAITVA